MNPDKGFRDWFAKTVIVYAAKSADTIMQNQVKKRIRDESDIRRGWRRRCAFAHIWGIGWACFNVCLKMIVVAFHVIGMILSAFCALAMISCIFLLLCKPDPFRVPETCYASYVYDGNQTLISAEWADGWINTYVRIVSGVRIMVTDVIGETYLNKFCK